MKFLFSLFTLVMLTGSCNSTKDIVSDSNKSEQTTASKPSREVQNSKSDIVKDNYNKVFIIYQANSRGSFEYIQISETEIKITKDRELKNLNSHECKKEDWEALQKLLKGVDVENLDALKAPTDKRLYDGAAHATFSVIKGDVKMTSPTFDHGAPPKEIEALVNKVLSITESISKQ
ncbi:hypothetical protein [Winogradskyella sp.]|jgi:hypothetical protein|uniref:hypothetical protein n=1 Tax=Winogradskyella sp. TaxID=1883156 RepID=UPI0025D9596A|nr:hypothetical protein [Winogradskyella sp.]MCT4629798.1 hypothetical protein [Winogradskyella sp.]